MLLFNDRVMADKDLAEAERLLNNYIDDSKCGWCRKHARNIRDAAKELRAASPTALGITKEFEERIGKTSALDGLDSQKAELTEASERNRGFKERLDKVLEGPRERVQERRPLGPRGRAPPTPKTEGRGISNMPGLPGFVTPDEVGQRRDDKLQRFRQDANRRTGPIREKIRFRIWDRLEDK